MCDVQICASNACKFINNFVVHVAAAKNTYSRIVALCMRVCMSQLRSYRYDAYHACLVIAALRNEAPARLHLHDELVALTLALTRNLILTVLCATIRTIIGKTSEACLDLQQGCIPLLFRLGLTLSSLLFFGPGHFFPAPFAFAA